MMSKKPAMFTGYTYTCIYIYIHRWIEKWNVKKKTYSKQWFKTIVDTLTTAMLWWNHDTSPVHFVHVKRKHISDPRKQRRSAGGEGERHSIWRVLRSWIVHLQSMGRAVNLVSNSLQRKSKSTSKTFSSHFALGVDAWYFIITLAICMKHTAQDKPNDRILNWLMTDESSLSK